MKNYKSLKSAGKASVRKQKVVDQAKIDEVKDENGKVTTHAEPERSHEALQVVCKQYDPNTGEAQDDHVRAYSLLEMKREIDHCKSQIASLQAEQAELEQLETDLKAL